jgi:hypothetical protein
MCIRGADELSWVVLVKVTIELTMWNAIVAIEAVIAFGKSWEVGMAGKPLYPEQTASENKISTLSEMRCEMSSEIQTVMQSNSAQTDTKKSMRLELFPGIKTLLCENLYVIYENHNFAHPTNLNAIIFSKISAAV